MLFLPVCVNTLGIGLCHRFRSGSSTGTIFLPSWGSNWGYSGFSCDQSNSDLSGTYVTFIYCDLSVKRGVKINTRGMPHGAGRS